MDANNANEFLYLKKAHLGLDGKFKKVSPLLSEYLGYTESELLSIKLSYTSHLEDLPKYYRNLFDVNGERSEFELRFIHKNGRILWTKVKAFTIKDEWDIPKTIVIYVTDISEYKNLHLQLEQQKGMMQQLLNWHHLVEYNPLPVLISIDGTIRFVNRAGLDLFDVEDKDMMLDKSIFTFIEFYDQSERTEFQMLPSTEQCVIKSTGEERMVEAHSTPIKYEGEEAVQTVMRDITKAREREQEISESLEEKKILLKEIHHRIKNNLAMISGLLELQIMNLEDKKLQKIIRESQLRIHSMALIHEKLYNSSNLSDISFDQYARELIDTIFNSYQLKYKTISVNYDLDEIELNIAKAVAAALILNELVSNCFKHAFIGIADGLVNISIKKVAGEITIIVSDNGVGLPDDFSLEQDDSLGTQLIRNLSIQLEGKLTYESENGATFILRFPAGD